MHAARTIVRSAARRCVNLRAHASPPRPMPRRRRISRPNAPRPRPPQHDSPSGHVSLTKFSTFDQFLLKTDLLNNHDCSKDLFSGPSENSRTDPRRSWIPSSNLKHGTRYGASRTGKREEWRRRWLELVPNVAALHPLCNKGGMGQAGQA